MGARCVRTGIGAPPTVTVAAWREGRGSPVRWPRNWTRSAVAKRRSRRRPTRRAGRRPASLQRRIDAWLTLRKRAASSVFSRLLLTMTLGHTEHIIAHHCVVHYRLTCLFDPASTNILAAFPKPATSPNRSELLGVNSEPPVSVPSTTPVRVLVVQDHPLLASAIARVLESEDDMTVVGVARRGDQAAEMAASEKPSVVLMDFRLPDSSGPTAAGKIRSAVPDAAIVFHSADESEAA